MAFGIESTLGLYALLSLIPFILLYLIRPKAKELVIPSLLFFMQQEGRASLASFFRHFLKDILFLIQLFIILLLALSFSSPYIQLEKQVTASNVVLIIDGSASSQVKEGSTTRFHNGIEAAKKVLGQKNTIILAKEVPLVVAQDISGDKASKILNDLKPADTGSRIGDAMLLAAELLEGNKGTVIVASDFINTAGQDPEISKSVLESKGHEVRLIDTANRKARNIGIVNLELGNSESKIKIRNYNPKQEDFNVKIGSTVQKVSIAPESIEIVKFNTPNGKTKILIDVNDDFSVDNDLFLIGPEKAKTDILLITNNASSFLKNALKASSEVNLEIAVPPVVDTKGKNGYDIIVIHDIDKKKLLPGTIDEIKKRAEEGTDIIIHAQNDSEQIDYRALSLVDIKSRKDNGVVIVSQKTRFTKNIEFGLVTKHFETANARGTVIAKIEENPTIVLGSIGKGKVLYYGLIEDYSDFKYAPEYPIFWHEAVNFLIDKKELNTLNYGTGKSIIMIKEADVETPAGIVKDSNVVLEHEGIYKFPDGELSANLLDELESDINSEISTGQKSANFKLEAVKELKNEKLSQWFFLGAALLLLFEFLYIKMRGDV